MIEVMVEMQEDKERRYYHTQRLDQLIQDTLISTHASEWEITVNGKEIENWLNTVERGNEWITVSKEKDN